LKKDNMIKEIDLQYKKLYLQVVNDFFSPYSRFHFILSTLGYQNKIGFLNFLKKNFDDSAIEKKLSRLREEPEVFYGSYSFEEEDKAHNWGLDRIQQIEEDYHRIKTEIDFWLDRISIYSVELSEDQFMIAMRGAKDTQDYYSRLSDEALKKIDPELFAERGEYISISNMITAQDEFILKLYGFFEKYINAPVEVFETHFKAGWDGSKIIWKGDASACFALFCELNNIHLINAIPFGHYAFIHFTSAPKEVKESSIGKLQTRVSKYLDDIKKTEDSMLSDYMRSGPYKSIIEACKKLKEEFLDKK
jgi:hypothetical protein